MHTHESDVYAGSLNATPADAVEGADFMETASVDYNSTTVTVRLVNLLPHTDYSMSTRSPVQPAAAPAS